MAVALIEHKGCGLALKLNGKGTTLLGHQTPLSGEHSRLNGCSESLDSYTSHLTARLRRQKILSLIRLTLHLIVHGVKVKIDPEAHYWSVQLIFK